MPKNPSKSQKIKVKGKARASRFSYLTEIPGALFIDQG